MDLVEWAWVVKVGVVAKLLWGASKLILSPAACVEEGFEDRESRRSSVRRPKVELDSEGPLGKLQRDPSSSCVEFVAKDTAVWLRAVVLPAPSFGVAAGVDGNVGGSTSGNR